MLNALAYNESDLQHVVRSMNHLSSFLEPPLTRRSLQITIVNDINTWGIQLLS